MLTTDEEAAAQFATGGSGAYGGLIDWITWGDHRDPVVAGDTGGTTRSIGGVDLVTTCTVDAIGGDAGGVVAYEPGSYSGDALDDLYNVGGTGTANTMGAGLANAVGGESVTIAVSCETTLDGVAVPVQGLVFADAETSSTNGGEYVQVTPDSPATWRVIERLRGDGCTTATEAVLASDGTLRLQSDGLHCGQSSSGSPGPIAVAFMEGATGGTFEVNGGGASAVALGVVLGADFGDAPAGYGDAGAIIAPGWTGGELSVGTTNLFDGFALASLTPPSVPRLGAAVDAESGSQTSVDASGDGLDDDGLSVVPAIDVEIGDTYVLEDVACTGPGTVSGWIDWNRNGTFDAAEQSDAVECTGSTVDLSWTVPSDATSALGSESTFLRLRIASDPSQLTATGLSTTGEVEDYAITVDVADAALDCPANAPGILFQQSPSRWYEINLVTGEYELVQTFNRTFNALGFNQLDGNMYAYVSGGASSPAVTYQIIRIGAGGSVTNLGRPAGVANNVSYHIGDVDENGHYWLSNGSTWYRIDLATMTVLESGALATPAGLGAGADWAYVPGGGDYLYRVMSNGSGDAILVSFNRTTHVQAIEANLGSFGSGSTVGAVYADSDGYLYSSNNSNGRIHRIDVNAGTATLFAQGPNSGTNDGSRCATSPIQIDFGDAPDSYSTTLDDDGPRHSVNGYDAPTRTADLMLGATIDFESDGQPSASATGDGADEDGLVAALSGAPEEPISARVTVTNNTGAVATLAGWIDLDGNGVFDASERVVQPVAATAGATEYTLDFGALTTTADTFSRFRLYAGTVSDPSPTGVGSDGEVEDHLVTFLPVELEITKSSDATVDSRPGDTVTYTVTAENTGTGDFTAANPAIVNDDLSQVLDDASYAGDAVATIGGAAAGPATVAAEVLSWEGPLAAGETVTITYSVVLGSNGDGEVRNVAWAGDGEAPGCAAPVDGLDPVTGVPCAETSFALPRMTVDKAADTLALPANGATVTYTITVENVGDGDYTASAPAVVTDDLTEVLDDATGPTGLAATVDGAPVAAPSFTSPEIVWSGPLASGEVLEITYTVTYDDTAGDHSLRNVVCVDESDAAPGVPACDAVQIPGAGLTQWKQATASDSPVVAGSTIAYTLYFANDGTTGAAVDARDDLSHVLDDAEITTAPSSADGLVSSLVGNYLGVTGTVPPGETYTVTYTVTVLADDERGDDVASNFLFERGPGGDFPDTPTDSDCSPSSASFPDCTSTRMPAIEYEKSVLASTTVLGEGTVLTYTITVRNTGAATGTVSKVDDLTDVLDDAEVTSAPSSDTASVIVSSIAGGAFSLGGTLAAGGVAEVTYEVTVLPQEERGDNLAQNFLVDPGSETPTACASGDPSCTASALPFIVPSKSVDPASGTDVAAGDVLTYTLSFENTGGATGSVDYTDLLDGIVDDAVVSDLTVVSGPLGALRIDDTILVTGELPSGAVATITYLVTVEPDGERGDNSLGNFLVETGDTPASDCVAGDSTCTVNDIAEFERWKTVSASSTPVVAGTVLTYNVFVRNSGEGAGEVDFVDDLTHVLDDADVTAEPASSILASPRTGPEIEISGTVAAGVTAVVTYQVTIGDDGERGDDAAANFLLDTGEEPPTSAACAPADPALPDCTITGIGHLEVTKSVTASTDPIDAGTELTYTLTFENIGTGPVPVDKVDDLAGVLDDATLEDAPVASDAALSASAVVDDAFTVTGSLAGGETVTVQYSVIVNAIDDRGDDNVVNFVLDSGAEAPDDCGSADVPCTETPLPRVVVSKTVDASTDPVASGTVLSYTLTFENVGNADGAVDKVDDLSGVLDDADLTSAPVASDPALAASGVVGDAFSVTGTLAPAQTVEVTYEVTVRDETERGDSRAQNFVLDPGDEAPADCASSSVPCTDTLMPELHDRKDVDPASGTPVVAGQELTYTLTFRNDGTADAAVDRVDDLTHVLDDADLVAGPTASDTALAVTAPDPSGRIGITGVLAPGETVTVEYTVEVEASGERGDDILANFVLDPSDNVPVDPVCETGSGLEPDCTRNAVGEIRPSKTSDPESSRDVTPGSEITYTLSFENVGAGEAEVDYVDYLADVLDDATFGDEPEAGAGLSAVRATDDEILVTGRVAAGSTVTVTYSVTVLPYGEQGDHVLGNFLVLDGFAPPTLCDPSDPLCTMHPVPAASGLAFTGVTAGTGLAWAILLLLGGAVLLAVRARGRTHRGA